MYYCNVNFSYTNIAFLKVFKHIPNILTLSNLFCGILSILFICGNHLIIGCYFIIIGAFFDFFDGMFARILNVTSEQGKQLDSFADMVTFGIAPSILIFQLFFLIEGNDFFTNYNQDLSLYKSNGFAYCAFLITIFSALRLSKFNISENQKNHFIGLPTPANALFLVSLVFIYKFDVNSIFYNYLFSKYTIVLLCLVMSFLLISNIPFINLKFKNYNFRENKYKYVFLILSFILLLLLHFESSPFILILYLLISIIKNKK